MNEIYWLTRIGELDFVFGALWVIPTIMILCVIVSLPIFGGDWNDKFQDMLVKWAWRLVIPIVFGIIGDIFTPSQKDVLLIYGLGTTIDYIENNEKTKELPDKAVDALTRYLEYIKEENNNE